MMAVMHDVICMKCDRLYEDIWWPDEMNRCDCGGVLTICYTKVNTPADHYVYAPGVDTERRVRLSEARQMAKDAGLNIESPNMEKHGGAREDKHAHGRLYSGGGIKRRAGYSADYGTSGGI